jgi:starch phosphorylase
VAAKKYDYRPRELYESNAELKKVIDLIANGTFSHGDRTVFAPIVQSLLEWDTYFLLSDFASYVETQEQVARAYATPEEYARMAILNVARVGKFSSDRSIADYCREIWHVHPVDVTTRDEQRKSHPTPLPPPVST